MHATRTRPPPRSGSIATTVREHGPAGIVAALADATNRHDGVENATHAPSNDSDVTS